MWTFFKFCIPTDTQTLIYPQSFYFSPPVSLGWCYFIITDENLDLTGLDAATATALVVYEVLRWLEHFMCSCTNIF